MQKITLNLIPDGVPPVVYVNQFDTGREFQISFKEGLSPYNFPSGVVFRINGRKADNHVFEYTESDKWDATHNIITKSGSGTSLTVTIATSEQMTAAAGDAEIQLTFKSSSASNDILGTLNFILAVQEKPDANGDPSESDLPDRVESVNGIGPDANGNVLLPPAQGAIGAHNIAPVEPTRIMSTARAAGTQVYVTADDQLYDIISPIGSGGTLTPGTNAIASSISSDLASLNDEIILSFPIFDSVTIGANISWLDFTFPVAAGDVFVWTMYAVSENPSGAITVAVSGSVGGSYLNGSRSHSQVSSPNYIFAKRATQAENIRISSFTNAAATFKGVAVTIRRKITLS